MGRYTITELLTFLNFIPAHINMYYIHLTFFPFSGGIFLFRFEQIKFCLDTVLLSLDCQWGQKCQCSSFFVSKQKASTVVILLLGVKTQDSLLILVAYKILIPQYTPSDQGVSISSQTACECCNLTKAREDNGEVIRIVKLYSLHHQWTRHSFRRSPPAVNGRMG
jgi:hypothetical protein